MVKQAARRFGDMRVCRNRGATSQSGPRFSPPRDLPPSSARRQPRDRQVTSGPGARTDLSGAHARLRRPADRRTHHRATGRTDNETTHDTPAVGHHESDVHDPPDRTVRDITPPLAHLPPSPTSVPRSPLALIASTPAFSRTSHHHFAAAPPPALHLRSLGWPARSIWQVEEGPSSAKRWTALPRQPRRDGGC